nr:MAG TPA: hypothetical protein [Caudoviricetes sp.]
MLITCLLLIYRYIFSYKIYKFIYIRSYSLTDSIPQGL